MRLRPLLAFGGYYCKQSSLRTDPSNMAMSGSSEKLPRVDFESTETVGTTRWMRLETLSYHVADEDADSGSAVRKWDRAVRTTKQSEESIDAVVILAILRHDANDIGRDEVVCGKSQVSHLYIVISIRPNTHFAPSQTISATCRRLYP